jgi:hypothetical protein
MNNFFSNYFKKKSLNLFIKRIWNSPTITTWGSFAARILSIFLVLPLVLNRFSQADITIWYLFLTILGFQILADMGFSVTFIRVIAFAMGGATEFKYLRETRSDFQEKSPNWDAMDKIVGTMYYIYNYLTPIIFILLVTLGTLSLRKPISYSENSQFAWIAWVVLIIITTIVFRGAIYSNYLQGINKIALLRRWQAIFAFASTLSSFIVLWYGGNILALVIINQSWYLFNVIRNYYFCLHSGQGEFKHFTFTGKDKNIFEAVWQSAWRSGLGVLIYTGSIHASSLIYAQVGNLPNIASYLLALRILNNISLFSRAPFYSKIPFLSRLRAEGNLKKQISVAKTGMQLSHWIFVIIFCLVGIIATPLLNLIGSNAKFVSPFLWSLMGLAFLLERFGAMHIQLYSITNHIIWHIANGISGIIYLSLSLFLLNYIDVYAFPIAMIVAQLGFYTWYSAKYSYRAFNLKFWEFERKTVLFPLLLMIIFIMWVILF